MSIYFISTIVFLAVLLVLVVILLLLESKLLPKGKRAVVINRDPDLTIEMKAGVSLLNGLSRHEVYLPSGCGGVGTCGLCKCKIENGGGEVLPTELPHLSRAEKLAGVRLACQVKVKEDMQILIPPEILEVKKYSAAVVSNRSVATFIKELVLKLETTEPLAFQAGGYMQIDIPPYSFDFKDMAVGDAYRPAWEQAGFFELKGENAEETFRAYSMANYPGEANFMFTIRIETPPKDSGYPPGIGSSYLFSLKPGDKVTLSGPFGDFFVKDTEREMCFIGGGAGMAPMRSQIFDQLKNKQTSRKMTYWYGARSRMEMFYDDELKALAREFPNFTYHAALSDPLPGDDWDGSVGFIHDVVYNVYLKAHEAPDEIEYYICGPPLMLRAVLATLENLGVEPEMIAYDDFGS